MKGVGFKLPVVNQNFPDCTYRLQYVPDLTGYFLMFSEGFQERLMSPILVRSAFCKPQKQTWES